LVDANPPTRSVSRCQPSAAAAGAWPEHKPHCMRWEAQAEGLP
jgi:hypothetical protein